MTEADVAGALCAPNRSIHLCLLLLLRERPCHGYELVRRLQVIGGTEHNRARVYRALRWLDDAGLVGFRWDTPSVGPARRVYELAPAGALVLDQAISRLERRPPPLEDLVARLVRTLAERDELTADGLHA